MAAMFAALVLSLSLVGGVYSDCTGCSGAKSKCCSQFGCCSQDSLTFYNSLVGKLQGSCRTDTVAVYSNCIKAAIACIDGGVVISSPACSSMVSVCFKSRCSASSTTESCGLTAHYILDPSSAIQQQQCLPKSCLSSGQAQQFTESLYSVVCIISKKATPFGFCALTDLTLKCAGVSVTCAGESQCTTTYTGGSSPSGTGSPVFPHTSAPARLCGASKTNCAVAGKPNGNTSCCSISGTDLGCCTPDVSALVDDLFANIPAACTSDLVKEQKTCFTKITTCLNTVQGMIASGTFNPLTSGTMLLQGDCNVIADCSTAAQQSGTCTPPAETSCKASTVFLPSLSTALSLASVTAPSGTVCLPRTCTQAPASLKAVSKLLYNAACFPFCQLVAGRTVFGLKVNSCIVSQVKLTCPSLSAVFASTKTCTNYKNISLGKLLPNQSPIMSPTLPGRPGRPGQTVTRSPGVVVTTSTGRLSSSKSPNTVLLVVICVAGVLAAVIVAIAVVYVMRRRRRASASVVVYGGLNEEDDDE